MSSIDYLVEAFFNKASSANISPSEIVDFIRDTLIEPVREEMKIPSVPLSQNVLNGALVDQWSKIYSNGTPGIHQHSTCWHPLQDPSFPFLYLPGDDAYIGFSWEHGEDQPLSSPLTEEKLKSIDHLYLLSSPVDTYNSIPTYGDARQNVGNVRFTIVVFRKPELYLNQTHSSDPAANRSTTKLYPAISSLTPFGKYLADNGFGGSMMSNGELCLFHPVKHVLRTLWYEWK